MNARALALVVVVLSAPACRTRNDRTAPTASAGPPAADASAGARAGSGEARSGARWSLLGRIVDLGKFEVVHTLTDPPDEEVTVPASDVVVVRSSDTRIMAFRLSTGERLWEQTPEAPCRNLIVAGSMIYSGCGDKVVARAIGSGQVTVVDPGPQALNPVLTARSLVSLHQDGRLNVYDVGTGKRRATRVVPELGRAFHQHVLANPTSDGVCVLGLFSVKPRRFEYRAGCYDDGLAPRWSKVVPMLPPRDPVYDVRQLGPRFAVLDDQSSVIDSAQPLDQGRGAILRWRDGEVTPVADGAFATLEDAAGERIPAREDDVFHRARSLAADRAPPGARQAQVVSDGRSRSFALIQSGGLALGGVDRATGHTLFLVPVRAARVSRLDMAGGLPVIRSELDDRWAVTVYDPATGKVLFEDARPPPRGR